MDLGLLLKIERLLKLHRLCQQAQRPSKIISQQVSRWGLQECSGLFEVQKTGIYAVVRQSVSGSCRRITRLELFSNKQASFYDIARASASHSPEFLGLRQWNVYRVEFLNYTILIPAYLSQ
jgi:hypothetical protein